MSNTPILCNRCDAAAQVVIEGNEPKDVVCPECGETESYAEFKQSVGDQVKGVAADRIGRALKEAARGSRHIRYKPGSRTISRGKFRVGL